MSFSTCVERCIKCGDAGGVDLSSYLCTECRVKKRRQEDASYPPQPYHLPSPNEGQNKNDKSISDIFNNIFRRK
jgi:hypothetical protein